MLSCGSCKKIFILSSFFKKKSAWFDSHDSGFLRDILFIKSCFKKILLLEELATVGQCYPQRRWQFNGWDNSDSLFWQYLLKYWKNKTECCNFIPSLDIFRSYIAKVLLHILLWRFCLFAAICISRRHQLQTLLHLRGDGILLFWDKLHFKSVICKAWLYRNSIN